MSEFKVRSGALKLKGEEDLLAKKAKKKAKKEKKKAKKRKLDEKPDVHQLDETVHGGWYRVSTKNYPPNRYTSKIFVEDGSLKIVKVSF